MSLLESRLPIDSITVMVQKEAADRLTAAVGSREAGAVTVAVNYYADAKVVRRVSKGSFMPQPNVDSSVIRLDILKEPRIRVGNEKLFFKFVRAGFEQRRKTLVNSVSSVTRIEKSAVSAALENCGLRTDARIESLSMEDLSSVFGEIYRSTNI